MLKAIARQLRILRDDIVRESEAWKIRCTSCGRQRSLLSVGGLRYGAFGEKHVLGHCSKCNSLRTLKIYKPADEQAIPTKVPTPSA